MSVIEFPEGSPRIARSPDGRFDHVPGEVTLFGEAALARAVEVEPEADVVEADDSWFRLRGVRAVFPLIDRLRAEGFVAQPNHVFWSHGCGGACPPHPALAYPLLSSIAHPLSGTPLSGTPLSGTPLSGTPLSGTPLSGTPLSGTRVPTSTARPAAAPPPAPRVVPAGGEAPRILILDSGLADPLPPALSTSTNPTGSVTGDVDVPDDTIVDASGLSSQPDQYLDPIAGHGTFIAGLIELLAPGARIHVRRILHPLGDVAESVVAAAVRGSVNSTNGSVPDIIGLSLGGPVLDKPFELQSAIAAAQTAGALVVASAGNSGTCTPHYPAAFPSVIGVGALGPEGPAPWSNYGDWVDACAPGTDLVSAFFTSFDGKLDEVNSVDPDDFDGWATWSGTSFAAPVVIAALAREMMAGNCSAAEAQQRVLRAEHLLRIPCFGTVVNL